MAARTGASIGVAITITLLGLLCLTLFVLTMVFYGQAQAQQRQRVEAEQAVEQFIAATERGSERVRSILDRARSERMSVVAYLVRELRETMDEAVGNPDATLTDLRDRTASIRGADANSLVEVIATRDRELETQAAQLAQAQADFDAANAARAEAAAQGARLSSEFDDAGQALRGEVQSYSTQLTDYQQGVAAIEARYQRELSDVQASFQRQLDDTRSALDEARNQSLVLTDQLRRLRAEGPGDRVTPLDEEALVDGRVDRVDAPANEVILSIGRSQKVVLGMTFAVYSSPTDLRPDEMTGAYPAGKAVVEVTRVEQNFSRARIIREARGNPIVRGDVVANAVYDPNKVYRMVVYGMFDRDNDGTASADEREEIETIVRRWGAEVVDEITGDLDFLVLGQRPDLPPPPNPGDPIEVVLEYARLREVVARYDELVETARSTSVPVLNANRLRTLIGDFPD